MATINYGYDGRGFFNWLHHHRASPDQNYSTRTYWRDERDRITAYQKSTDNSVNPMEDGRGNHYWYDPEGQLTDAYYGALNPATNPSSPVRTEHFEYDQLGNRQRNPSSGTDNLVASKGWMHILRRDNRLNQYTSWENNYPSGGPLPLGFGDFLR